MTSRGKNFTEREKCKLLELVQRYKHIIENKCTNAISKLKKSETWEAITREFNSTAEIPRTQKQLTTAYLNLKRTTRQNVANENVKRYLQHRDNDDNSSAQAEPSQIITINEPNIRNEVLEINSLLNQFKRDEIADKKAIRATGGGTYIPVLSSVGAQMIAVMGDQIKPLPNTCDSASNYYKNDEPVTVADIISLPDEAEHSNTNNNNRDTPPCTKPKSVRKSCTQVKNKRKLQPKQQTTTKGFAMNNQVIKRNYYKKKLESAVIEKKTKLLEYKLMIRKQKLLDLEIKIKEKEYENLHYK